MATETYTPIATTTLASSASSVTFSSIDQSYGDLVLVFDGITDTGGSFRFYFNSDTGTNYSYVRAFGNGSTAGTDSATESGGRATAGTLSNNSNVIIQIMDYAVTDKHKSVIARANTTSVAMLAVRWADTSAITDIELDADSSAVFQTGTTFSLFGIAK